MIVVIYKMVNRVEELILINFGMILFGLVVQRYIISISSQNLVCIGMYVDLFNWGNRLRF